MVDELDVEIKKEKIGSALVVTLDTEFSLKNCFLTKKYEAKLITDTGVTQITEPLVELGNYIAIIWHHTRYAYKIAFIKAQNREDIVAS